MPYWYRDYVPVAVRRARAEKQLKKRLKKGQAPQPVEIEGTTIARSFWGKGWCKHLESFSDYANRLPRGRTYARNGSVCHLDIQAGRIDALVAGSSLYSVTITIKALKPAIWDGIKKQCTGQIGSMLELLQGKLSNEVMSVVSDRKEGLFPQPGEMALSCSCPDSATMCKHVAAVLYGVGHRLDTYPELLFQLRNVDAEELIVAELALPGGVDGAAENRIASDQLSAIFGIDFDAEEVAAPPKAVAKAPTKASSRRAAAKETPKKRAASAKPRRAVQPAAAPAPRIRPSGKSVARLRRKLGMTVAQFAEALGVTSATVYRWESTPGPLALQQRPLAALAGLHARAKAK